jgi:hypothetical protein
VGAKEGWFLNFLAGAQSQRKSIISRSVSYLLAIGVSSQKITTSQHTVFHFITCFLSTLYCRLKSSSTCSSTCSSDLGSPSSIPSYEYQSGYYSCLSTFCQPDCFSPPTLPQLMHCSSPSPLSQPITPHLTSPSSNWLVHSYHPQVPTPMRVHASCPLTPGKNPKTSIQQDNHSKHLHSSIQSHTAQQYS